MHTAGVVPEDAPDPRLERAEKLKAMPVPVVSLVDQPALEVMDIGVSSGSDGAGYWMMAASVTSTLWRNPADKSDPANLAELDDTTRRALDEVPPWPRPAWLVDQIERMRYPIMWEAVQTTWHREQSDRTTVDYLLVHHTNHILMNQFREAHGLGLSDWESPALASSRSIRHGIDLVIDGKRVSGAEIDTDPFVYAVGAKLGSGATLTAVIAREHLPHIDLAFASGR